MDRVQNTKIILWLITGLGAAVGVTRLLCGLGVTTNLNDATPWGLWIGFDVMAGVALAGGGFVITAMFYIMRRAEFHPFVKPAVLTAFLGYLAVIFGLLFDLGLPWNIWHMIIYWNPHSPLFEVGWCVMLYTAVLLLEFSPVPLEKASRYAKIRRLLMKLRLPLVGTGIALSTLHQSSLGSLFLIMPLKLHPLWYSSIIPVQFFLSAMALGLMIVSLESLLSHWLYRRKPDTVLIARLAKISVYVLAIYLAVKLADIAGSGEIGLILSGTFEANLFIAEVIISAVIPMVIFIIPRTRAKAAGQWVGSSMVVLGMIFNRINVGGLTMIRVTGDTYVPSWTEISISLGVISVAGLVFMYAVEKFHIWENRPEHPEADRHAQPVFDHSSEVWLGSPAVAARTKYSLLFILSFAVGFAAMPGNRLESKGVEDVRVHKARGGDTLFVDGNRDGYGVIFDHARHSDSLHPKISCSGCHHMNMPQDRESGCWQCHRAMYTETEVFDHRWHSSATGGNIACIGCHNPALVRQDSTAKQCADCHLDLVPIGSTVMPVDYLAGSYVDVMHQQCLDCHRKKAAENPDKPDLALCPTCHQSLPATHLNPDIMTELTRRRFNRVIMPAQSSEVGEHEGEYYGR